LPHLKQRQVVIAFPCITSNRSINFPPLTREQHVLVIGKRLLSHIKLLGPRQRINLQLEENQKAINPQRSDLNNKTKDYRRKGNTTKAEELKKQKDQIPSKSVERLRISPNVLHAICKQYLYNLHSE
jgi:hypothetical protein